MLARPLPRVFRRDCAIAILAALLPVSARAVDTVGQSVDAKATPAPLTTSPTPNAEKVAVDIVETENTYVGSATYREKQGRGGGQEQSYGSFDEQQLSFEYDHRFPLFGKVWLKLGAEYERFDLGTTTAPLPSSLSSLTGTVAIEYIEKGEVGAFLTMSPGVYYSDIKSVGLGNVDVPTSIGTLLPLRKWFYLLIGVRYSALSHYPFYPILGAIVLLNDHLRIEARPPTPRLIYSYSKQLDLYVGAELLGSAYKRDSNDDARLQDRRFNNGVIDFSETRVGGGATISPIDQIDIEIDGGYSISRDWEYYRGDGRTFRAHPAPYARIAVSMNF